MHLIHFCFISKSKKQACFLTSASPIALKKFYPAPDIRQDDDGLWYLTATITTEGEIL